MNYYNHSKEFDKACQFIFTNSPINFCSIGRVYRDGSYSGFMSDPLWTEFYLNKHALPSLTSWLDAELSQVETGYSLWSMSSIFTQDKNLKLLQDDCAAFNYHNGINFIDTYPDYFECVRFSSAQKEGIDHYFLDKQDLLRQFILLIKEKIHQDKLLFREINTAQHLPQPLSVKCLIHSSLQDQTPLPEITKYYIGTPLHPSNYLTIKEIKCLIPSLMGISNKIIAHQYQISNRTVEKHLEKIKSKMICNKSPLMRTQLLNNKFILALAPNIMSVFNSYYENLGPIQEFN